MMGNRTGVHVAVSLCAACVINTSSAHHSVAGFFNPDELIEIEGVVTATLWRNPHTEFEVEVTEPSGESTMWRVETGAISVLRARGLDRAFLHEGDQVKVYGLESLRGRNEIFAYNLLLGSGTEVLLTTRSSRYFTRNGAGELLASVYDEEAAAAARRDADGIFRVWSTNLDEIPHAGVRMFHGNYPMTEEAEAKRLAWDAGDPTLLGCTEWNMPYLMFNPLPMQFVREGEDILLQFEEDDNERMIYMNSGAANASGANSLLGHSTGYWDDDSLVVETDGLEPNVLDVHGTPFSSSIKLIERFTPSTDGSRLLYRLQVTDPETFTEPFEVERYWIWRPEIAVARYACAEEQRLP
jgi:hypothetical protein